MKQLYTGIVQASALHPFGEAETGRRAGEIHQKPWHASTPGASLIAPQPCAAGCRGASLAPTGRRSFKEKLSIRVSR